MSPARKPMPVGSAAAQLPGHRPGSREDPIDTPTVIARAAAAKAWRRDHEHDQLRDHAWRWFCEGMLRGSRPGIERNSLVQAIDAAARAVPWAPRPASAIPQQHAP